MNIQHHQHPFPPSPINSYDKFVSSVYDTLIPLSMVEDLEFYRDILIQSGQPALELGSGTGRLLLPLLQEGFDISGLECSQHMLDQCEAKAKLANLSPVYYHQTMENMSLDRHFQTILIPLCTLMLITEIDRVKAVLKAIYNHLFTQGTAYIPLFLPFEDDLGLDKAPPDVWRLRRSGYQDGHRVECWERAKYRYDQQIKASDLRFNSFDRSGKISHSEVSTSYLRWHTQNEFRALLLEAGFTESSISVLKGHSFEQATPHETAFTFAAKRL